jgi:hypothetical protein
MALTPVISAAQVTQRLITLEQDHTHFWSEMALFIKKLERRLEKAKRNFRRVTGRCRWILHVYQNTAPESSEHRPELRTPPPTHTTPGMNPIPASTPTLSPFAQTLVADTGTSHNGICHPPRASVRSSRNMGNGENVAFLPYAIEKTAAASQKMAESDRRTW